MTYLARCKALALVPVLLIGACQARVSLRSEPPADTLAPVAPPAASRPAPAPVAPMVARSLTPVRLYIRPRAVTLDTGAAVTFCGYVLAADDTLRLLAASADRKVCRLWYRDSFPSFRRDLSTYPVAYMREKPE